MDHQNKDILLDLKDIVGQPEVTPQQAEQNRLLGRGVRRPRPAKKGYLRISRTSFLNGVRIGTYPAPIRLGRRTLWRLSAILAIVEQAEK